MTVSEPLKPQEIREKLPEHRMLTGHILHVAPPLQPGSVSWVLGLRFLAKKFLRRFWYALDAIPEKLFPRF